MRWSQLKRLFGLTYLAPALFGVAVLFNYPETTQQIGLADCRVVAALISVSLVAFVISGVLLVASNVCAVLWMPTEIADYTTPAAYAVSQRSADLKPDQIIASDRRASLEWSNNNVSPGYTRYTVTALFSTSLAAFLISTTAACLVPLTVPLGWCAAPEQCRARSTSALTQTAPPDRAPNSPEAVVAERSLTCLTSRSPCESQTRTIVGETESKKSGRVSRLTTDEPLDK